MAGSACRHNAIRQLIQINGMNSGKKICPELTLAKYVPPRIRYARSIHTAAGAFKVMKRLTTLSIRLGLFAMLMMHVGPLYSAFQLGKAPMHAAHPHNGGSDSELAAPHDGHHREPSGQPHWLDALEMCGYCELLTLSPPLTLLPNWVVPQHRPAPAVSLPQAPARRFLVLLGHPPRAPPISMLV